MWQQAGKKRRSRSTPPVHKRPNTEPGTHGPFTADLARANLQGNFPGASPKSTKKIFSFQKQLYNSMDTTRAGMETSQAGPSSLPSQGEDNSPSIFHVTPPVLPDDDAIEDSTRDPLKRSAPRVQGPLDLQDVLTQQTEVLAGMMQELRQNRQAPCQAQDAAEPPADPLFQWDRLALHSETAVRLPGDGMVLRMATSLFAKVPLLTGRDQYEAHFVLQMVILWLDLSDDDEQWVFQRLNVYCIVAALGWTAATAACKSSMAVTDFVLPLCMAMPQPNQPQQEGEQESTTTSGSWCSCSSPSSSLLSDNFESFYFYIVLKYIFSLP